MRTNVLVCIFCGCHPLSSVQRFGRPRVAKAHPQLSTSPQTQAIYKLIQVDIRGLHNTLLILPPLPSLSSRTMGLLASVERYSQGNYWQHVTAEGLRVKIQHVKKCFTGETLPAPTAKVIAAWNDLPNAMLDIPPKSTKTGFVFLRVLTPTPTGLAFDSPDSSWEFIGGIDARVSDTVAFPSHDSSWTSVDRTDAPTADAVAYPSRDCHDSTRELSLDNTDTPASNVVASQGHVLKGSTALDSSRSLCSHPDQSSDRRNAGEDSVQSTNRNVPSPPSNNKSYSSGGCAPWTSAAFHNMVNQWFAYYRALKTEAFVKSLVAFGVKSLENALLASRVARVIIKKVVRESDTEGRILGKAIRSATLELLREYWESVSQYHRLPPLRLGQQSGMYRTITTLTAASIWLASSEACSMQRYPSRGMFTIACPFYWKERNASNVSTLCTHCWSKPTTSYARIATSRL